MGTSFRRLYQLVNHTCQQILSVHAQDVVRHMQALLYRALCHRVVQTEALAPLASRRKVCLSQPPKTELRLLGASQLDQRAAAPKKHRAECGLPCHL